MKILCGCGHVICDNTDYITYKAHLISDQDIFEALELSDTGSRDWFPKLARGLWECTACGRLYIDHPNGTLASYLPEERTGRVIAPAQGDKWPANLRAGWRDEPVRTLSAPGYLSCARGNEEVYETFDDWNALKAAYDAMFAARRREGTLRDAMLFKNGLTLHSWDSSSG